MATRQQQTDPIGLIDGNICNFDLERQVIAYLIHGNMWIDRMNATLSDRDFVHPTYKELYKVIANIYADGNQVTPDLICEELHKHKSELTELDVITIGETIRQTIYLDNPKTIVKRLNDYTMRRILANMGYAMADLAQDISVPLTDLREHMLEVATQTQPEEKTIITAEDAGKSVIDRMVENRNLDKPVGTATGFSKFDEFGGLHNGDLIIVAGDTSNGKTSFALSVTLNAVLSDKKVAYYSLEMSSQELMARILAIRSGVSASTQLYKRAFNDEYDRVFDAYLNMPKDKLLFDDRATIDFESILNSIRTMKRNSNIDGVVVDYIQILNVNNKGKESQEQMMAQVARRLKNLAKELDIWVMALSQLSRNNANPEPTLSRLRDSGQIAEAADVVILIYRPELYGKNYTGDLKGKSTTGTAQIEIAKGRNIGLMKFIAKFNPVLTHFYEGEVEDLPKIDPQEVMAPPPAIEASDLPY